MNRGMTLVELSLTMAIAAILFGMILGLSRHVDESVHIQQAQVQLGAWATTLERWRERYGEYPHFNGNNGSEITFYDGRQARFNLSNLLLEAGVQLPNTNDLFRYYLQPKANLFDPWGVPYVYIPEVGFQSYQLVSCGPDRKTEEFNDGRYSSLDDIHLER